MLILSAVALDRQCPRHTRRRTSCYTYKHCIRRGHASNQQIVRRLWALADYYELTDNFCRSVMSISMGEIKSRMKDLFWFCTLHLFILTLLTHDKLTHCLHLLTSVSSCWRLPMLIPWVLLTGWSGPTAASILGGHQHQSPPGSRHIGTPTVTC